MHLRTKLLNAAFQLLYGRLVLFHEIAGRVLWGGAWSARRAYCIDAVPDARNCIDLGAGEGFLIIEAQRRMINLRGIEPSRRMRTSAWANGVYLVNGSSIALPLASSSVDAILITYPGSWIFDEATWREIERIATSSARVAILVGGTYLFGRGAFMRRLLSRASYGSSEISELRMQAASCAGFDVQQRTIEDGWGTAIMLVAERVVS